MVGWAFLAVAQAATLQVGADKPFATIAAAAAVAVDDDVIEIDSGVYLDDAVVLPALERLTLRGVGPTRPILRATASLSNELGLLVVPVDAGRVTLEHLQLEDAFVTDGVGAAVHMLGRVLNVNDSVFLGNQVGILSGGRSDQFVTVTHSEFGGNGRDGSTDGHHVQVNTARSLIFEANYCHGARSGHAIRSYARGNTIRYNRIMDESVGSSNHLIDLPIGGMAVIQGNLLQHGPNAENIGALVSFGTEVGSVGPHRFQFGHNTLVNDHPTAEPTFVRIHLADELLSYNNLFVGAGAPFFVASGLPLVDGGGDLSTLSPGFVDRAGFDYHLLPTSPARDAGVEIPPAPDWLDDAETLAPEYVYLHPAGLESRRDGSVPDVGAYGGGLDAPEDTDQPIEDTGQPLDDTDSPSDTDLPDDPDGRRPGESSGGCACDQRASGFGFAGLGAWLVLVLARRPAPRGVGR